jgi:zeaxanthin glucosyltransferase
VTVLAGARIGLVLRPGEPGHQACALALAKRLSTCGCHVTFIGLADDRAPTDAAGFAFLTLSESAAPLGTIPREKELARLRSGPIGALAQDFRWVALHKRIVDALPESFDRVRSAHLDLVICDIGNPIAALVALGLRLPCMLFETTVPRDNVSAPPTWTVLMPRSDGRMPLRARIAWLRAGLRYFQDLIAPLFGLGQRQLSRRLLGSVSTIRTFADLRRQLPRIVACPRELEFPGAHIQHWFYVDALVDLDRAREPFSWDGIPTDRDLVYIAMGTQTWLIRQRDRLFDTFLQAASLLPDAHILIAAGDAQAKLGRVPGNVSVVKHAAQLAVLSRASVMVTHGGLNSVKECISMGVPMIVLPVDRDQPGNAARVAYHKLGLIEDYRSLDAARLSIAINDVRRNPAYRTAALRMKKAFEACRSRNEVVDVIAGCVSQSAAAGRAPTRALQELA